MVVSRSASFFFFNDTPPTEIYTLSLHDALPISSAWLRPGGSCRQAERSGRRRRGCAPPRRTRSGNSDRKSTRLNSSHLGISYAVFCLKKKKQQRLRATPTQDRRRATNKSMRQFT